MLFVVVLFAGCVVAGVVVCGVFLVACRLLFVVCCSSLVSLLDVCSLLSAVFQNMLCVV